MDPTAMAAGGVAGLVALLIGLAIGVVIGALFIMLGSKIVMGSAAKFGSACLAAIASSVAGFVIGLALGAVVAIAAPNMANIASLISMVAGIAVTPLIYSALVRTNDGRAPTYIQGLLIYLIQLAIVIALVAVAVLVFKVPIPGLPAM